MYQMLFLVLLFCLPGIGMEPQESRKQNHVEHSDPFFEWLFKPKTLSSALLSASIPIALSAGVAWRLYSIGLCPDSQEPQEIDCMNTARFAVGATLGAVNFAVGCSTLLCYKFIKMRNNVHLNKHSHAE